MKNYKVLHIAWSGQRSGMLTEIVTNQKDINFEILFCADEHGVYSQKLQSLGYTVHCLNMSSKYGIISNIAGIRKFHFIMKDKSFEVVHLQEIVLPYLFLAIRKRFKNSKILLHSRGEFPLNKLSFKRKLFFSFKKIVYALYANKYVDHIISNSDFTTNHLTNEVGVKPSKISRLYNAANIEKLLEFRDDREKNRRKIRQEFDLSNTTKIIVTASRLVDWKRIDYIIKASSKLRNKDFKVFICGEGIEMNNLQKLTKDLGLNENIVFLGFRTDVLKFTSSADLFVLPSCGEAFGISCLESIILKVPILAMQDGGGMKELIKPNYNGMICNDLDHLTKLMGDILYNDLTMSDWEYDDFISQFSIDNYIQEIDKAYQKLLS